MQVARKPARAQWRIPDEFVERDVREALSKPQGELTCEDLERLTELTTGPEGDDDRPFSLEGLQYATNLERLTVAGNRLSRPGALAKSAETERACAGQHGRRYNG